jgi:hypothetical protein
MKKLFVFVLTLAFLFTVALVGCEKKQEAPKPLMQQPAVTPPPPPPAPAPAPAPAKPAKK